MQKVVSLFEMGEFSGVVPVPLSQPFLKCSINTCKHVNQNAAFSRIILGDKNSAAADRNSHIKNKL